MAIKAFLEIFFVMLAGQYFHVLIKVIGAMKKYGTGFKMSTYWDIKKKLTLLLNGSFILLVSIGLVRAHIHSAIDNVVATAKPFNLWVIELPSAFWVWVFLWAAFIFVGYFAQSILYLIMKSGKDKANLTEVADEKEDTP
jgi:hypothetical protein